ncbi:MaoC/PaaZ C-terminal domain-containing protein [Auritidibacter ignavus]|uniref:MaoC/PaaZ C-terminal domain-containing protein n=1 Tax=Auritidibacter ignavus TaxID=678932 RepID=UPI0024BB4F08|nr:MaoC/PaaZ C-terminal domain-containing protein [Auritidibacter ignavus]WHS27940.1 MaoC/PaaZ C-terminal domain-containing protein [Auritidibacter ignavus]
MTTPPLLHDVTPPTHWKHQEQLPSLGALYGKVAAGTVGATLSSLIGKITPGTSATGKGSGSLPTAGWKVTGQAASRLQVDDYIQLFGATGAIGHDTVPSLALHIATFPLSMGMMASKSFPLPLLGLVHLDHTVDHLHPVAIDQPLIVTTWADSLGAHRRGTTVAIWVQIHDEANPRKLLWQGRATYLSRGIFLAGRPEAETGSEDSDSAGSAHRDFQPPVATASWRLPADTGRNYAGVSGDVNPIHMNHLTAKALGMPGMIAHGMYLAGRMLAGREPQAPFSWQFSFAKPVTLPTTVAVAVEHSSEEVTEFTGWNPMKKLPHFFGQLRTASPVAPRSAS